MSSISRRVEWPENRCQSNGAYELFLTIAEKDESGLWHFFERSSFEVRWFPIGPTEKLIKTADAKLAIKTMTEKGIEDEETAEAFV